MVKKTFIAVSSCDLCPYRGNARLLLITILGESTAADRSRLYVLAVSCTHASLSAVYVGSVHNSGCDTVLMQ